MFKLFQSIFGADSDKPGAFPEELIARAIERAVDGTDRRLRAVSGYQKKLRPAVLHAIEHVVDLVRGLPPPLALARGNYGSDPELNAYFVSVDDMQAILARDAELRQWQKASKHGLADRVFALLIMELRERNVLGVALEGDQLRRDVAQVTLSFTQHRLVDPTGVEEETRRLLMRRAFDHLLTLALGAIAESQGEHGELERERNLLRNKLAALASGHWGFGDDANGEAAAPPDPKLLQQRIKEIDAQLSSLRTGKLDTHLDILVAMLASSEQNLYHERITLHVDRQGVKQAEGNALAPPITFTQLHNAAGISRIVRLVGIARDELPPPVDFLREAQRYLG